MAEHSDENSSKQCAPRLPCHYGYMAIGTGNDVCWQPPEDRRMAPIQKSPTGYEKAKEQVRGANPTQSSSRVSPFKRARLHALNTTVRSGYSSVLEKIRHLRD